MKKKAPVKKKKAEKRIYAEIVDPPVSPAKKKKIMNEMDRRWKKEQIDYNRFLRKLERDTFGPPKKKNKPTRRLKRI